MPAESPQPEPLQPRELNLRKPRDFPEEGLGALYEWSSSIEEQPIIASEEDSGFAAASPKPRWPKKVRARIRRCYLWIANTGLRLCFRFSAAALFLASSGFLGWLFVRETLLMPEWPEIDLEQDMPEDCREAHATLVAEGLDPSLLNFTMPPWPKTVQDPTRNGRRGTIAYLGSCGFLQRLGIVVRVFATLYRPEDFFLYQSDPDTGVHDPLVEVLSSRFGGSLPANVRVSQMPGTGRVFYWGHTANVLAAIKELLEGDHDWQWLIRLHDSAYPLHAPEYMRYYLESQPGTNFIDLRPWMEMHWMSDTLHLVHPCGPWVGRVGNQRFPQAEIVRNGFRWAMGDEWWIITRTLASYFTSPSLEPFFKLMRHRVNVEEILWASMISNIPGFSETVSESLVWCIFSGTDDWRDAKHSPDNIVDDRLDSYFDDIKLRRSDLFFVRKVRVGHSEGWMRYLDASIEQEKLYYAGLPD